jgi:hypothetical protein
MKGRKGRRRKLKVTLERGGKGEKKKQMRFLFSTRKKCRKNFTYFSLSKPNYALMS